MKLLPLWIQLLFFFALGTLLGGFFFGGLWWTTRKLARSTKPVLFVLASFSLRTAVVLTVFFLLARAAPLWMLATLAGFFIARMAAFFMAMPPRTRPKTKGDT